MACPQLPESLNGQIQTLHARCQALEKRVATLTAALTSTTSFLSTVAGIVGVSVPGVVGTIATSPLDLAALAGLVPAVPTIQLAGLMQALDTVGNPLDFGLPAFPGGVFLDLANDAACGQLHTSIFVKP